MKKTIICMFITMLLFINTSIVTSANTFPQLISVELSAGDDFSFDCDLDKHTIAIKDLNITAKYDNNTEVSVFKHIRTELVRCERFAVVEIYSDPDFSFIFTFVPTEETLSKIKLTSSGGILAKYTVEDNKYLLTNDSVSAQLTYSNGEVIACPVNPETETTVLSANKDLYITLDNAVIYKNNFSRNDESVYKVDFVKTGQFSDVSDIAPEKYGYGFNGWYIDKECTEKFDFSSPINSNTVIYAGWTQNKHSLTVKNGSGSGIYATGDTVTIKAEEAENKVFSCWTVMSDNFKIENPTDKILTFTMPDCDVEIQAGYTFNIPSNSNWLKLDEKNHFYIDKNNRKIIEEHNFALNINGSKLVYTCHECGYSYVKNTQGNKTSITVKPTAPDVIVNTADIQNPDMLHAQRTATGDTTSCSQLISLMILSFITFGLCRMKSIRKHIFA